VTKEHRKLFSCHPLAWECAVYVAENRCVQALPLASLADLSVADLGGGALMEVVVTAFKG
jgi:hypothetical protein